MGHAKHEDYPEGSRPVEAFPGGAGSERDGFRKTTRWKQAWSGSVLLSQSWGSRPVQILTGVLISQLR